MGLSKDKSILESKKRLSSLILQKESLQKEFIKLQDNENQYKIKKLDNKIKLVDNIINQELNKIKYISGNNQKIKKIGKELDILRIKLKDHPYNIKTLSTNIKNKENELNRIKSKYNNIKKMNYLETQFGIKI